MAFFGNESTTKNYSQTQADNDNLAADAGAVVVKSGGGTVWLSDPGAIEAIGETLSLGRAVTDGAFHAVEEQSKQNSGAFYDSLNFARSVTADALHTFEKQTENANDLAQTSASLAQQQFAQSGQLARQAITTSKDDGTEIILSGIKYGAIALALILILPKVVKL